MGTFAYPLAGWNLCAKNGDTRGGTGVRFFRPLAAVLANPGNYGVSTLNNPEHEFANFLVDKQGVG